MHLGLLCPPLSGHLNPMTTLGRELQRRGHRVTVLSLPDGENKVRATGLEFAAYGGEICPPGWTAENAARLGELSGKEALQFTMGAYRQMTSAIFQSAVGVCRDAGFDALLLDQTNLGSQSIAEALNLPYVSVCNALPINSEPGIPPWSTTWPYDSKPIGMLRNTAAYLAQGALLAPWLEDINTGRKGLGLPALTAEGVFGEPRATVTQLPAALDFPRTALPSTFHYTGPWHTSTSDTTGNLTFPYHRLNGKSLIYASLGTLQNRLLPVFEKIASAVAPLDAQLVVALGRPDAALPTDWPGDPIVVGYAPQLELVRRAALVITHAGLNTVLETLAQGVPMVALPIANDQPGIAARVKYHGVGEWLTIEKLKMEMLRVAAGRVLTDPTYREKAVFLQQRIAEADGINRAAGIVEAALGLKPSS